MEHATGLESDGLASDGLARDGLLASQRHVFHLSVYRLWVGLL